MDSIAIKVENLSKRYRIGLKEELHDTLGGALTSWLRSPISNFKSLRRLSQFDENGDADDVIWALRDVSFEVKQGEVVGIIGRNGAGKSTLLKLLSRITEPTSGRAVVRGRVSSLLEVGTGFHPELTGRENVYLNGTILGMTRPEIDRKFDEIVAFAEVEKFIDTPVKRYSSGMQVRLAFAVAAHLEPEILLVDEVLAVGDWDFQKKCLGRVGEISREGRTVLLVSHNMASVLNYCPRALLIDSGRIKLDDPAANVVQHYIAMRRESGTEVVWKDPASAPGDENVRLHKVRILTEDGEMTTEFDIAKDIQIQILFWNLRPGGKLYPGIYLKDQMGTFVLASPNLPSASITVDPLCGNPLPLGLFQSTCRIPGNLLNAGTYILGAFVNLRVGFLGGAYAEEILTFDVFDSGEMRKEHPRGNWPGVIRPRLAWHTKRIEQGNE